MKIIHGDCLEKLKEMPENSVDSIVTDPPYGLSFMGKKWDYDVPSEEVWKECLRVLKPGGHLLSFAGTRTQHRMAVRIEDAGFEIRDMIAWVYGQGFPKSHNVANSVDKKFGCSNRGHAISSGSQIHPTTGEKRANGELLPAYKARTEEGKQWEGWGTALKPALEPITVARKPLIGTVAENVLTHGTGGINIEKSRVPTQEDVSRRERILAGEVVCNGFCDKHESYPRSLADICAFSPQQFLDYLQHISSELKAYSSSYSNPLRDEASLPGTLGKALLGVPCDYDLLALRVEQCGREKKGLQDFLSDYPTLSRLCGGHAPHEAGDGLVSVPSANDVLTDTSRLLDSLESNPSDYSNLHLVFVSVLYAYNCSKDLILQHNDTTCKNKSKGARWPSNLIHDGSEEVLECFPNTKPSKANLVSDNRSHAHNKIYGEGKGWGERNPENSYTDSGSAARFFYCAKASKKDRDDGLEGFEEKQIRRLSGGEFAHNSGSENSDKNGASVRNNHPTVKPTALMRYLVKLVTPPGGTVLDPFTGSGSTGKACKLEGFEFIGIEREEEYVKIAEARIEAVIHQPTLV